MRGTTDGGVLPRLGPGDLYLYAHGNGAIFVMFSDRRSMLVTMAQAIVHADSTRAEGGLVFVGHDDGPVAADVLNRLAEADLPLEPFAPTTPPHWWQNGCTALMEAASVGSDHLFDDLLDRGVDPDTTDVTGSSAAHHAAKAGNLHAIDSLFAAGANLGLVNDEGFTPAMIATHFEEIETARRISTLATSRSRMTFKRSNLWCFYVWAFPVVTVIAVTTCLAIVEPEALPGAIAFSAGILALVGWIIPPRAFWAGGAPRELVGNELTLVGVFGHRRVIDLDLVTFAGITGTTRNVAGARYVLLAHPDGHDVTRRSLRRLLAERTDIDELLRVSDRYVVVALDGGPQFISFAQALDAHGVVLSKTLRSLLTSLVAIRDRTSRSWKRIVRRR